ncbi:hypothetical protein B9W62_16225 [Streptomyces sp. CS113]|uniref:hypothetical protein n=2 Tax=unclassified Streptomyces TaxID=2593676 RepID=UPI000B41294F|nr:hypothetical protein [Streptomyces sp. CS113]OWA09296.1 hypothetical protein B9W62_16225 [Streptomyces sp. CS113]
MARSALTMTAATFAATAALLLTACGGEDSSPDDIKGAETGASTSSPSASASGAAGVKRPDVSLPEDLKLVFDFEKPSDADAAAALDDAANYIRALNHGITEQDVKDPAYGFYSAAGAARYAESQIQEYVDGGWTLTGEDRYYQAETSPVGEGEKAKSILVTFCEDQSKAYGKEVKTGKVHRTEESLASYQKFSLLMAPQQDSPVWRAQQITVEGKAAGCRH